MSFENPKTSSTLVKRGKVNLSQHEKICVNGSLNNMNEISLSNSLSKDVHNNSTSFEKVHNSISLTNTLNLNKQMSSGKKYQKTSSGINNGLSSINNNSSNNNNNNINLNNSISNGINA